MPRGKRFSDIRRSLIRRLDGQDVSILIELRDELWRRIIARHFFRHGRSIEYIASDQPSWNSRAKVEDAIRDQANKRRTRSF